MDTSLTLEVAENASVQLLQITDTHLFATRQETLLGVNSWQSYQAVLQAIIRQGRHYDLVVATGDLVQDQSVQAYQHFAGGIATLAAPCVWLPGNHDFQPAMYQAMQQAGICAAKRVFAGAHWQLLLLDSQVPGVAYGELSDYQLDWLVDKLRAEPSRHTLLLLHHHPQACGCQWLDQHSLRNAPALHARLADFPLAKHLVYGHIHQALDSDWHGRRLLATPATSIQFKPHSARFALDSQPPGWRWLSLHPDGTISTEVCRLPAGLFLPDIDAEGY